MTRLDEILDKYPFVQRDNLIPILQDIQDEFGCLSEEAIVAVGKYLNLPTAKIYGLASFYHHFRFIPNGKYHIQVCNGTSCHANENALILNELEKQLGIMNNEVSKDGVFSLEETNCMASCGYGPLLKINEKYYTQVNIDQVTEIINYYKSLEE